MNDSIKQNEAVPALGVASGSAARGLRGVLERYALLPQSEKDEITETAKRIVRNAHEKTARTIAELNSRSKLPACTPECGEWACGECPLQPNNTDEQRDERS